MMLQDDLLDRLATKTLTDNTADGSFGTAIAVGFNGKWATFFIKQQGLGASAANSFGNRYKAHMFEIFGGIDDGTFDMACAYKLTDELTHQLTRGMINAYAQYWES